MINNYQTDIRFPHRSNYISTKNSQNYNFFKKKTNPISTNSNFQISPFLNKQQMTFSSHFDPEHIPLNVTQELCGLQTLRKMSIEIPPDEELPYTSIISIASEANKKQNISEKNILGSSHFHPNIPVKEQQIFIEHNFQKPEFSYKTSVSRNENINHYNSFSTQESLFRRKSSLSKEFNNQDCDNCENFLVKSENQKSDKKIISNTSNIKNPEISVQDSFFNSSFQKSISRNEIPYTFKNDQLIFIYQPRQTLKRSANIRRPKSSQNRTTNSSMTLLKRSLQNTSISSEKVNSDNFIHSDLDSKIPWKNNGYLKSLNFIYEPLNNENNKIFLHNQAQNEYYNISNLGYKNNTVLFHSNENYYNNQSASPVLYKEFYKLPQSGYDKCISSLSNNNKFQYNLSNIHSLKNIQMADTCKSASGLSNPQCEIYNSSNFFKKSLWENFSTIKNNKEHFDLRNKELKKNEIENMNNNNEDTIKINASTKHLNSIQNHNLKYNFFLKNYSITKDSIMSLFSSISNYKKKLLDKKTYICETSKYFLTKYLKGKKHTNKCSSNPFQLKSFSFTRFPIHIEYRIYHLAHIKLLNPRRPLYQQDQIILEPKNELHEYNYSSSFIPKYSFTPKVIQDQAEKTIKFQIKKTDKGNYRNKHLINDDIDLEYKTCTPYLINSLDPTIFDYNNLNIPFTYNNYDKEFNDMYSISNKDNYLHYNQPNLDTDILDSDIPIIKNIDNILYI
ncbi:hypothetical protein PCANB_000684 [Pneumocystis canis]|nr:hypothetical protein PCANB_000684 [Pneumocystis canis]